MFFRRRPFFLTAASLLGLTWTSFAETITLQAIEDTSIYQLKPDGNIGSGTLLAGTNRLNSRSRAMFRFDLAMIPVGAIVEDVEVRLSVVRKPDHDQTNPVDSSFGIYRLLVDWGEGNKASHPTGTPADVGEATWLSRFHGFEFWGAPGGEAGVDYADTASSSTYVEGLGAYTFGATQTVLDDVQGWIADPATNFGYMLINLDEAGGITARRFASTEQPEIGVPPTLVVTYTVPEPSSTVLAALGLMACGRRFRRR